MDALYAALRQRLAALDSVLVAYSGGVDSALLVRAAVDALGPGRVLAGTARSPVVPAGELQAARELPRQLGVTQQVVDTDELSDPEFRRNPEHRCFLCKGKIFGALVRVAAERGLSSVVEGSNADDTRDHRPGIRAVQQLGVLSPYIELGITKAQIRAMARDLGLPVWDKPALACLASRIPYGSEITVERLRRIDRAEAALRELGFAQVRVRDHGTVARIEVAPASIARLLEPELRARVQRELRAAGYPYVAVDLAGYRTGAMNETLGDSSSPSG